MQSNCNREKLVLQNTCHTQCSSGKKLGNQNPLLSLVSLNRMNEIDNHQEPVDRRENEKNASFAVLKILKTKSERAAPAPSSPPAKDVNLQLAMGSGGSCFLCFYYLLK